MIKSLLERNKKQREKEQKKKDLKKVAAGTVIGTTIALLLSPKSGKETREEISKRTNIFAERIKDTAKDVVKEIKDKRKQGSGDEKN